MHLKSYILYLWCLWSTFYLAVNAGKFLNGIAPNKRQAPIQRWNVSTLTPDSFPSWNAMSSWLKFVPRDNTCVFYTGNLTQQARSFASSSDFTTIWDIYPNEVIYISKKDVNDQINKMFYSLLDEKYTASCSGTAWLMMPTGFSACADSMWKSEEYMAITRNESKIDRNQIQVVDEKGNQQGLYNSASGAPEFCPPFPKFTGNDPINYWGN